MPELNYSIKIKFINLMKTISDIEKYLATDTPMKVDDMNEESVSIDLQIVSETDSLETVSMKSDATCIVPHTISAENGSDVEISENDAEKKVRAT